jgi:dTDP-glucose 4,6-dehydratase
MKRILITGAAGSIGVHVMAHIMKNTDWEIVTLDSYRHKGFRDRITKTIQDHPDWKSRIEEFETDLVCPISPELEKAIGHIDYILHLAACSDVFHSVENPIYVIQNNVNSTLTMLEYARRVEPEQFIYFSTDEVYGMVKSGNSHKEWETHRPSNAYSASKAACEDICYAYWRSYGVPIIITNTMNNFGEMQSPSKFPVIIQKKVETGEVVQIHGSEQEIGTRYYIHSRNSADAILHIIKLGAYAHKIGELDEPNRYNIVGDQCVSNLELAQLIAKLMGKELKYELIDFHKDNPAHDIHYGLDGTKLKNLGWISPMSFEESLKNTIEWQSLNKEWIK